MLPGSEGRPRAAKTSTSAETTRTVVVIGATGLIGKALAAKLIERGYRLVVFSRDPARAREAVTGAAKYVEWQPDLLGEWAAHLDDAYAVVNLAGAPFFGGRVSKAQFRRAERERVAATRMLVQAMGKSQVKPEVFVSASAVGAYGMSKQSGHSGHNGHGDDFVTEKTPPGTDDWAQGTAEWERAGLEAEALGVRVVLLRTGVVWGYEGGALVSQLPQFERGFGVIVLPGTEWMPNR